MLFHNCRKTHLHKISFYFRAVFRMAASRFNLRTSVKWCQLWGMENEVMLQCGSRQSLRELHWYSNRGLDAPDLCSKNKFCRKKDICGFYLIKKMLCCWQSQRLFRDRSPNRETRQHKKKLKLSVKQVLFFPSLVCLDARLLQEVQQTDQSFVYIEVFIHADDQHIQNF